MKTRNLLFGATLLAGVAAFSPAFGQNMNITGNLTVGGTISGGGTTTNDSACTGCIGEYISQTSFVTSAPSLVTTVPAIVTQVLLTAGDWSCYGNVSLTPGPTASVTVFSAWSSTTNAAGVPQTPSTTNGNLNPSFVAMQAAAVVSPLWSLGVGTMRYSLSASTSVYLLANATFSAGGLGAVGTQACRRMR